MTDQRLRDSLQASLDPVALPDRFQTPERLVQERLKTRRAARWQRTLVAAVAAVALLLVGTATPLGRQAVAAVRAVGQQVVMTRKVTIATPEDAARKLGVADRQPFNILEIKPGDLREIPYAETPGGWRDRQVFRGTTVRELLKQQPGLPLPAYLGPRPGDTAVVVETYFKQNPVAYETRFFMVYSVRLNGQERWVAYDYAPGGSVAPREREMTVYARSTGDVRTETVHVHGRPATAMSVDGGNYWHIDWESTRSRGFVAGNIPLAQLVKMAESVPDLRP